MLKYKVLLVLIISNGLFTTFVESDTKVGSDTLVLLHVLFRHGNRTSDDASTLYTTDPYKNYDFYPYGQGELTKEGKRTEYRIGKALRNQYNDFLGETYTPDILYAQSTAYNRTKMSLQLVLASLFPPRYNQIWSLYLLNWQPIPYNYAPIDEDPLLFPFKTPEFEANYAEYQTTPEYQSLIAKYQGLFDYVSENVGTTIATFTDIFRIFDTLKTHEEYGLALPEWSKSIYPDVLEEAGSQLYQTYVATENLKQTVAGCLLKKVITDTNVKINNASDYLNNTKLFLYSAHDINLATVLITLGLYDYSYGMPPYGSYVVFEVHQFDSNYGIQIYFQNYTQAEPLLLTLPGCSNPCPIDDFIQLTANYYPSDSEQCTYN